jgi:hypothetical protein
LLRQGEIPTTRSERSLPEGTAIHRVRDKTAFDGHLNTAAERIREFSDLELHAAARYAGAGSPDGVAHLLANTREEMPAAVDHLRKVLYQP